MGVTNALIKLTQVCPGEASAERATTTIVTRRRKKKNRMTLLGLVLMYRVLKYSRLKGKLPEVLAKDHVSAIAVGSRFIVGFSFSRSILTSGAGDSNRHGPCSVVRRRKNQLLPGSFSDCYKY